MARLVFRPYTCFTRSICTSKPRSEERREGKSVDLGGRRIIKKKNKKKKKKKENKKKKKIKNKNIEVRKIQELV